MIMRRVQLLGFRLARPELRPRGGGCGRCFYSLRTPPLLLHSNKHPNNSNTCSTDAGSTAATSVSSSTSSSTQPATSHTSPPSSFSLKHNRSFLGKGKDRSTPTPMSTDKVFPGEAELMAALKSLGLDLPVIAHEPKHTVEEANKELERFGTPCTGTKNMFLKSKKGEFVLLTALHTTKTDIKDIQKAAGTKDLRFAPEEILTEELNVVQGSVTPFALINNLDKRNIIVIVDKNMETTPDPFVLHPCRNDKSMLVTFDQLTAFLKHINYPFKVVDFGAPQPADAAAAPAKAPAKAPKAAPAQPKKEAPAAGETKLGMQNTRADNFSGWYTEMLIKSEMIEYYDISGCYIIRPLAYYIWSCVQSYLGANIRALQVEDCYFPMFVSQSCLEREKEHVEGFAPEVAWVTRAGETDLEKPIALRPTSETVMYPYYAKWIRSHRDLPLRLNQWNNVIRWEFSHPTPFIRTREFLWQEGHCAYATLEECAREVLLILEEYAKVYEQLLAVPVIRGQKTEKEKFAGGYYTTTVETYVPAIGRGCQGATSHNLGQNFGKMFDIKFQDPDKTDGSTLVPWQSSWGLTTRVIGVMIMVHGDDRGMVLPPRVAQVQAVIIPVGITSSTTAADRDALLDSCKELERQLVAGGVRARSDLRDNYSPGWRFNHWEIKGTPVRIEVGPKELAARELALAIRHSGERRTMPWNADTPAAMTALLEEIYAAMYNKALADRDAGLVTVTEWADFVPALNRKCIIQAPWCGDMACEDAVKKDSAEETRAQMGDTPEDSRAPSMGAKTLCVPFKQPPAADSHTCICKGCTKKAAKWVVFGRSF